MSDSGFGCDEDDGVCSGASRAALGAGTLSQQTGPWERAEARPGAGGPAVSPLSAGGCGQQGQAKLQRPELAPRAGERSVGGMQRTGDPGQQAWLRQTGTPGGTVPARGRGYAPGRLQGPRGRQCSPRPPPRPPPRDGPESQRSGESQGSRGGGSDDKATQTGQSTPGMALSPRGHGRQRWQSRLDWMVWDRGQHCADPVPQLRSPE